MLRFQEFSASLSSHRVFLRSLAAKVNRNRKGWWLLLVDLGLSDTTKHSVVCLLRIWLRNNRGLTNPCSVCHKDSFFPDSSVHSFMFACWQSFAYRHAGILFTCLSFSLNPVSPCCKQLWHSIFVICMFFCQGNLKVVCRKLMKFNSGFLLGSAADQAFCFEKPN